MSVRKKRLQPAGSIYLNYARVRFRSAILANTSAKKLTEPKLFLRTYSRSYDEHEVPDPYYGGDSGFRHVLDLIEDACDGLIDDIRKQLR